MAERIEQEVNPLGRLETGGDAGAVVTGGRDLLRECDEYGDPVSRLVERPVPVKQGKVVGEQPVQEGEPVTPEGAPKKRFGQGIIDGLKGVGDKIGGALKRKQNEGADPAAQEAQGAAQEGEVEKDQGPQNLQEVEVKRGRQRSEDCYNPEVGSRAHVAIVDVDSTIAQVARFRAAETVNKMLRDGEPVAGYDKTGANPFKHLGQMVKNVFSRKAIKRGLVTMFQDVLTKYHEMKETKALREDIANIEKNGGQGHQHFSDDDKRAMVKRFCLGLLDGMNQRSGERERELAVDSELSKDLKGLINEYVLGNIDKDQFVARKDNLFRLHRGETKGVFNKNACTVDNLLEYAEELKEQKSGIIQQNKQIYDQMQREIDEEFGLPSRENHEEFFEAVSKLDDEKYQAFEARQQEIQEQLSLNAVPEDFVVRLGKSISEVREDGNVTGADRIWRVLTNPAGFGGTPMAFGYAALGAVGAYSLANRMLFGVPSGIARTLGGAIGGLFGGALLGGAAAAVRKNQDLKRDRAYAAQVNARGYAQDDPDQSPRLTAMRGLVQDMKPASELIQNLQAVLHADPEVAVSRDDLVKALAEADVRLNLGRSRETVDGVRAGSRDYIQWDAFGNAEVQRANLLCGILKAKQALSGMLQEGETLQGVLEAPYDAVEDSLLAQAKDVDAQEKAFRREQVKKAFKIGFGTSLVGGALITGAKGLYDSYFGSTPVSTGNSGAAPSVSQAAAHPVSVSGAGTPITVTQHFNSPQDFIHKNPGEVVEIHNRVWMDNNTGKFDLNELKIWNGGKGGSGITPDGKNFVFDVSHMKRSWSFHGGDSVDAVQAMNDGDLKMWLTMSRGTQHHAFEFTVTPDGKVLIPVDSTAGKVLFEDKNGQMDFLGAFAEVGVKADGHTKILATEVGRGIQGFDLDVIQQGKTPPKVIEVPPVITPDKGSPVKIPEVIPYPFPPRYVREAVEGLTPPVQKPEEQLEEKPEDKIDPNDIPAFLKPKPAAPIADVDPNSVVIEQVPPANETPVAEGESPAARAQRLRRERAARQQEGGEASA